MQHCQRAAIISTDKTVNKVSLKYDRFARWWFYPRSLHLSSLPRIRYAVNLFNFILICGFFPTSSWLEFRNDLKYTRQRKCQRLHCNSASRAFANVNYTGNFAAFAVQTDIIVNIVAGNLFAVVGRWKRNSLPSTQLFLRLENHSNRGWITGEKVSNNRVHPERARTAIPNACRVPYVWFDFQLYNFLIQPRYF